MKSTFTTQALVLNRKEFGENDLKVDVLTRDRGRFSLVARGAKKMNSKLAAHVEPFTLSDIMVVKGRQMDYIGSAVGRESFLEIKNDLVRVYYAGKTARFILRYIKEEEETEAEEYFHLLRTFWELLDKEKEVTEEKGELWYIFFVLHFLHIYGLSPQVQGCVRCGVGIRSGNNAFHIKEGGIICPSCYQGGEEHLLTISDECIKILKLVSAYNLEQNRKININSELLSEFRDIVYQFFLYNNT